MTNHELTAESPSPPTEAVLFDYTTCADAPLNYPAFKLIAPVNNSSEVLLNLPEGPWSTLDKALPDATQQQALINRGYTLDSKGRPLHPRLNEMIRPENGGVFTGKGMFYHWGPNYTGDPIIITEGPNPKIALIKRKDNGQWGFAGGFVDPADGSDPITAGTNAAVREAFEELGLDVFNLKPLLVCQVVVDDFRATAHAWPETTAVLLRPNKAEKLTPDYNEVLDAQWFPLEAAPKILHGSHGALLTEALKLL